MWLPVAMPCHDHRSKSHQPHTELYAKNMLDCNVGRTNTSCHLGVRTVERIKYAVGAACRRPFAASQTRGGRAAAPTHDFVGQALDPYFFASALAILGLTQIDCAIREL